jgi:aminoglycoside 6'-N-acetyltransferase I
VAAIDEGRVVRTASGVHYVHPDGAPQLFINEIAVPPPYQQQGIVCRLMERLLERGRELGYRGAWRSTDRSNTAARRYYAVAGGVMALEDQLLVEFDLGEAE